MVILALELKISRKESANLAAELPDLKDQLLAGYEEFLLEIDLKILLRKTGARLNFKIALISLNTGPGLICLVLAVHGSCPQMVHIMKIL
jgi:hypothetical protein